MPWPARVYFVLLMGGAAVVVDWSITSGGLDQQLDWATLLVLALLCLVCESVPTQLSVRQAAISVSFSAALAAVVLVGPEGATLVTLTAVLSVRPNLSLVKR